MADYWKSQAKKYCDFCKCWLADNRPSIEFHEKGKKHKDNVARSLKAIGRRSRKDQKESCKMDLALKRMESAALEAYRRDVEGNANADISSKALTEALEKNNMAISSKNCWYESKTKEGETIYWNKETNEKLSVPPSCGFLDASQQQAQALEIGKKQMQALEKYRSKTDLGKIEEGKHRQEEERAAAEREKMKERRVVEEEPPQPVFLGPIIEQNSGPYGNWKSVVNTRPKNMDLQLPKQEEYIALPITAIVPEPPMRVFKEKTVETLSNEDDCSSVGFKKRKFGSNSKRNTRQRLNDD